MNEYQKMNLKTILRWFAVPLAAVATYLLTHSVFFLFFYLQSKIFGLELDSYGVMLGIIAPGLAAYFVVLVSWYVAPEHKNTTAMIIYVLFVFIAGVSFAFEIMATAELWRLTNILVQIAAGAYALWQIKKQEIKVTRKEI